MTDQSMSNNLFALVSMHAWPEPRLAGEFLQAADSMWGTEAGRAEVQRWLTMVGKDSEFVEEPVWTVQQLREHFTKWDEWDRIEAERSAPPVPPEPKRSPGRPRTNPEQSIAVREAAARWHAAVQQRKEMMGKAKLLMESRIQEARTDYHALRMDWDKFVETQRQSMLTVQKSTN
jgi:hypothetical protein